MPLQLPSLIPDKPEDWTRCFGLMDNPFSPSQDQPPRLFRDLGLETTPLRPHLDGFDWLRPDYYAHDILHVDKSLMQFFEFVQTGLATIQREGLITLVHGGEGSGKTSFTNACRSWLRKNLSAVRCVDFEAGALQLNAGRDAVATHLTQKLAENHATGVENPDRLVVLLVENLLPALLLGAKFETNQSFQFLNWIADLIRPSGVPVIFATTWEPALITGFSARSGGEKTDRRKIDVREFRADDVLNYIRGRVALFRDPKAQAPQGVDLTYFPFDEASVRRSFRDTSEQEFGLPVRSVNRILSRALQQKKGKIVRTVAGTAEFGPAMTADEVKTRVITTEDLVRVVKDWTK